MQHVAVTDHGVMYASMEWYKRATEAGLHPIVGMEAYLAEGKASVRDRKSYHLLLLAENIEGYRNLLQLASKASLEGFYYRPRIDLEMLQQHREGLIATSACLGGPVANNFLHEQLRRRAITPASWPRFLARIASTSRSRITVSRSRRRTNRSADSAGAGAGAAARRHQRCPLRSSGGRAYSGSAGLRPDQHDHVRSQTAKRIRSALFQESAGNVGPVQGRAGGAYLTRFASPRCATSISLQRLSPSRFRPFRTALRTIVSRAPVSGEGCMRLYGHDTGEVGERLTYELGVIRSMGFTELLPGRLGLRPLRERERHSGRTRTWLGGRQHRHLCARHHRARSTQVRPDLRAIPQSLPHLDAGHRHRLCRRSPRSK